MASGSDAEGTSFWGEDESLQRYRALVNAVDGGLYQLDADGRFVGVNDAIVDRTGYARDDLLGAHASTLFDDDAVERIVRNARGRPENGEGDPGWTDETRLETAGGETIPCEVRAAPMRADGEFDGIVGVVRDAPESGEGTPAALENPEEPIATVLDRADVGVFLLDDEFEVAWIDETAERYFGIDRASAVGRDKRELVETTIADRVAEPETFADTLRETYAENDAIERFECRVTAGAEREERWLEHVSQPIGSGAYAGGRIEFYYDVTDRKASERAYEERSQQFRSLVHAVDEYAIFMLDPEGRVITWNRGAERIKGYDREEILGEHFSAFYTEEDADAGVPEGNLAAAAAEGTIEDEGWRVTADGTRFWANVTITAIRDEDGALEGFAKVTRDMTDRREREQLRNRERYLERYKRYIDDVLDAIDDVFYVVDEDGTLRRWNESLGDVTGYADEEIQSMDVLEFFDADAGDRIAEAISKAFESGGDHLEADIRAEDGDAVPYEFVASPLESPEGTPVLAGIGRNVAERKAREAELERRTRQQQAVADLGQVALETDDLDELMDTAARTVADVLNNDYCKVLDLDTERDELLLRQGVGWDDGIVGEAAVSAVERDSQAAYTLEHDDPIVVEDLATEERFSGPDLLRSHDVRSGISTVIGPFDEPWGILGTHDTEPQSFSDEDVSFVLSVANILAEAIEHQRYERELERLVADLEESNERLEQFAYAASHDLQEPLRMVSSYLQLIESRYAEDLDEEGLEFLAFAVDGAERMREMIEALLEYSRVETRGDPFEPVDLDSVLDAVLDDLQLKITESDAEIAAADLPRVAGDESQLRQVFLNLLENAIEYSGDAPPRVEIEAERAGDEWLVSIRDEGIGIDPDHTERVFQVFERLHSAAEHDGTGIGLALCKRIVQRHGGEIRVDSEPGEGTTFSFTLPAADDDET